MPKLQRKHTFLRLTIYIYRGALLQAKWPGLVHSTNPPRLVHLIWGRGGGWPYRRYSRLRICVGKKKKKKIELPTWLLRLLFSFVTYRPGFIYFLCNEMPRYQWRRGRERPLSIVRLWRKFEITAPRKRGYSPLLYRKMAARAFESFDNFHRSGIRDRYIYIYVCMYIYIYIFFFSSFSFIIPLSLVRTRFQRDLAVKMFVNIFSRNDLYGEIIIHVYDRYWDTSATLYKFFQIYPWMGIILFDVQLGKVFPFSRWIYSKVGIKPGWVKKLSNR